MYQVQKVATERDGGYITYYWANDRKYKVFENAEKRVMELQKSGVNARLVEVKR